MKRTDRSCFPRSIALKSKSFGLSLACLGLTVVGAEEKLDLAPVERWLGRMGETKSVKADFVQQRYLRTLRRPLSTEGRLWLVYPDHFRWELGEPPTTIAIRDKERLTVIEPKKKSARLFSLAPKGGVEGSSAPTSLQSMTQSFPRSMEELVGHYEIRDLVHKDNVYELILKPRDKSLSAMRQVVFFIDAAEYYLHAVELQFGDNSKVRTSFTRLTFNHEIPATTFKPDLEGYQVEK